MTTRPTSSVCLEEYFRMGRESSSKHGVQINRVPLLYFVRNTTV